MEGTKAAGRDELANAERAVKAIECRRSGQLF
jgi:hypothetical protein